MLRSAAFIALEEFAALVMCAYSFSQSVVVDAAAIQRDLIRVMSDGVM
jgi:hypothetical protein